MKIGIANDHAGVDYKNRLVEWLKGQNIEVVNFGTDTTDSMDYPDVAHPLAQAVLDGKVDLGIALCGTGNGMAITCKRACNAGPFHSVRCCTGDCKYLAYNSLRGWSSPAEDR